jgi:C-terminal processing protease CtpA/Prc
LPDVAARHVELARLRDVLDRVYAHRLDKERRAGLDEDALFAELERRLVAADSWARYDAAIYDALARFHDSHLSYHPPATAAPARGYASFHLGFVTVLARDHLLVASVESDSDVARAGITPGDEVVDIDGKPVADALAAAVRGRAWSRPESATTGWAETWTIVLEPVGQTARTREVGFARRGPPRDVVRVTIQPRDMAKQPREPVTVAQSGDVAVVTIRSLMGGHSRAKQLDEAFAQARATRAIVVDLRGDRGGIDLVGERIAADVVEGTAALGTYRVLVAPETLALRPRWKSLTAEADGFSAPQLLSVAGLPAGKGFHGPVAVVVDAGCVSTCEVQAAALRADAGAVVVGQTTGGSSGAPVEVELPVSHSKVAVPTWSLVAADGQPIEGHGVVPDVEVVPTPDGLAAGRDEPLAAAIDRVSAKLAGTPPP